MLKLKITLTKHFLDALMLTQKSNANAYSKIQTGWTWTKPQPKYAFENLIPGKNYSLTLERIQELGAAYSPRMEVNDCVVQCPNNCQRGNKAVSSVDGKESLFVTEKVFDVLEKYLPFLPMFGLQ